MRSILESGGEVRTYRPPRGGFASMHAKTWVLDSSVILTGSVNTTENGFDHNHEHFWVIRLPEQVSFVQSTFERIWPLSREVTARDIGLAEERIREKRNRRSLSRRARSTSTRHRVAAAAAADADTVVPRALHSDFEGGGITGDPTQV